MLSAKISRSYSIRLFCSNFECTAPSVVKTIDVVIQSPHVFKTQATVVPQQQLTLERRKNRLGRCIVIAVANPPH